MERIGIVGLGNMGLGMAKALRRQGCDVAGYHVRGERVEQLIALGGAGALLKELFDLAVRELGAGVGDSKVITLLERWGGVEVRG